MKNKFKSVRFRITQALDVFSHEVQQRDLTYFTDAHESNQMLSLFGNYFMALDWDYESDSLFGFESFKDKEVYIDVLAALPDNNKVLLYSNSRKKLYYLSRQKPNGSGKFDRIYEQWQEIKLKSQMQAKQKSYKELKTQDDLDILEELAYNFFGLIQSWLSPAERMNSRRLYVE